MFLGGKIIYHVLLKNLSSRNPISFDLPVNYQISVEGKIDPTWSDRLEGMKISLAIRDDAPPVTTLEGKLSDQAALAGVLNSLYELHLTVISVNRVDV